MKKVSALILAVLFLISAVALVSCGGKPDATSGIVMLLIYIAYLLIVTVGLGWYLSLFGVSVT